MKKLSFVFCLLFCISCVSTKYIPVSSTHLDSTIISKHSSDTIIKYVQNIDSVYLKDSIFIQQKGDTVFVNKYLYLFKYKMVKDTSNYSRTNIDSIYINKVDSILIPYKVEVYINKLYVWLRVFIYIGILFSITILLFIGFKIYKIIKL